MTAARACAPGCGPDTVGQHRVGVTKVHVFSRRLAAVGGRVLDVGCGGGEVMTHTAGLDVVGVDRSLEYCVRARARGERTVAGDLERGLPFRSGTFAGALCSDTFEHLLDPLGLLVEIHRVLRPGGLLFCHVPNEFSWKSLRQVLRGEGICSRDFFPAAEEWDYPHVRFFSHKGFVRMLARGGFTVEHDLTAFGRGWRRHLYPLFGSGPSIVARRS